uniref:Uncharacterized protein n=1 Tax=Arundo donax TaxID=35708 RepID=A0A0A9GFD7_ARUDO
MVSCVHYTKHWQFDALEKSERNDNSSPQSYILVVHKMRIFYGIPEHEAIVPQI